MFDWLIHFPVAVWQKLVEWVIKVREAFLKMQKARIEKETAEIQQGTAKIEHRIQARIEEEQLRSKKVRDILHRIEQDEADTFRAMRARGAKGTLILSDDQWLEHFVSQGEPQELVREALQLHKSNKASAAAADEVGLPERWKPRF
jgi:hypothetical protein